MKVLSVGVNHQDSLMLTSANVGVRMISFDKQEAITSHDADVVVNRFEQVSVLILSYGYNSYRTRQNFMYLFIYRLSSIVFCQFIYQFYSGFSFSMIILSLPQ